MHKDPSHLGLSGRINITVAIVLILGLSAVALAFALSLIRQGERQTAQNLERSTKIIYASIENMMLSGEAPIAVSYFKDVESLGDSYTIALFRRDASDAFSDNLTIETVNRNQSFKKFQLRSAFSPAGKMTERDYFDLALQAPAHQVLFRLKDGADGHIYDRVYKPLLNLPKCTVCHGSDHTVRGVMDIRTDITPLLHTQAFIIVGSGLGFLAMAGLILVVLGRFLHTLVVQPVRAIGAVCTRVSQGDFTGVVDIPRADEVGDLGRTVNEMVHGLHERYELTKYVSSGTLRSLANGQKSEKVKRTLLFTDVRGFTAYTERHGAEAIVAVLNALFEEQTRIIHEWQGDIDKFVGDEVVAVFSGEDAAYRACMAAESIRRLVSTRAHDFDGLCVGAGIATGLVIQGMLGSRLRADFTVIGDRVNIAARLCGVARKNEIVVCDCTVSELLKIEDYYVQILPPSNAERAYAGRPSRSMAFMGPFAVRLKGKSEVQHVYVLQSAPEVGLGGSEAALALIPEGTSPGNELRLMEKQ